MILHIIQSNSPALLEQCLNAANHEDIILLIENAVYLGQKTPAFKQQYYVLAADLLARGLVIDNPDKIIDDKGFVDLVCNTEKSITWYP